MMTESVSPPVFQDFPQDDGWNVSLEVCVKLHVYEKFYNLWRSGGYQNATDYVAHLLLLEEHNQIAFRSLNESDPHKEERLTMELSRQLLDIAESAKQQETPSAPSSNPADHDDPSSPLHGHSEDSPVAGIPESQVHLITYSSQLQPQALQQQLSPISSSIQTQHSSVNTSANSIDQHCLPSKSDEQNLHNNNLLLQSVIQQVKMPPLIPVSALVTPGHHSHLDQSYLVPEPSSKESQHNPQLQAITIEDYADIKTALNGPSQVPPNSPCGPNNSGNTAMPVLQKLPGIGELCKRPIQHMGNGFRTSPDHLMSPGGFQPSPLDQPSTPEVSSTCDSTSSRRPYRKKAEAAKQFIHTVCSPDSFEDADSHGQSMTIDDFDESDFSDSEDANNNSVRRKLCRTECETCQEIFLSDEYLMQHYHDNPTHQRHPRALQPFNCEMCSQLFEGKPALVQHLKNNHPEYYRKKTEKLCSVCNIILPNKQALRQHLRSHEPDLTVCPERGCSRVVKRQHIAQHMTKIHGESQVTCDDCGKVFRNVMALKAHTQNVHKGFKYVCSFAGCHRSFKRPSTLKVHELIHKDFKPMKCKLCSFRCRQQASISHHFKQHHPGVKPGFLRQSEAQVKEEIMLSPSKNPYSPQDIHSPVKRYLTPSPEMIHSPEMMSDGHYHNVLVLGSNQMSAEVC